MNSPLSIANLQKSFKQGENKIEILKELDFSIARGECVAILGQSGSGKSTLLSLIAGFDSPDSGELILGGESTRAWTAERWDFFRRKNLGFIFQNYHLIPYLTAEENVALPLRLIGAASAESRARELLKELGLMKRADHLPGRLSGGEKQRVAIARAVAHDPELILADEPTGSLDRVTGQSVLDSFFATLRERRQTALVVTHSFAVAERCDRRVELKDGRLCSI